MSSKRQSGLFQPGWIEKTLFLLKTELAGCWEKGPSSCSPAIKGEAFGPGKQTGWQDK